MSNFWRDNRREFDRHSNQNSYYNDNPNFSRFSQDRYRKPWSAQAPTYSCSGENNFNYRNYRDSSRYPRRSSSVPRTSLEDEKNYSNNFRAKPFRSPYRPRRSSVSSNFDNSRFIIKDKADRSMSPQSENMPQLKKFRSIFGPEKMPDCNSNTNSAIELEASCNTKEIEPGSVAKGWNNVTVDKEYLPDKTANKSNSDQHQDLSIYCGESVTELRLTSIDTVKTELPVVNWSKDSYTLRNLPVYGSSKTVGGDGITLELFYLCKYCKMFTAGSQLEAHLKSKYHYDRYKSYLTTGEISSPDSSGSSSEDEKEAFHSPVETQNQRNTPTMEIDSSDIMYHCHQELDFD